MWFVKLCYLLASLLALIGAMIITFGVFSNEGTQSAIQEIAIMVLGLSVAIIPFIIARSFEGIARSSGDRNRAATTIDDGKAA